MAAVTINSQQVRHILGDLAYRQFNVTAAASGDTLVVPGSLIQQVNITPTTATAVGCTISGSTVTFVSGGAFTAAVGVLTRVG
jgi:hypothetical protein